MSRSQFMKMSALTLVVVVLLAASLIASDLIVTTIAAPQSVIVQLKSEPVVVAKATAEARGQNFDLAAYRQQIIAEQNQFLDQLSAAGVDFSVASVDAPNGPNGEVSNIQFRFNYVFNGVTLAVPASAIETIEAMSQVKSVHISEEDISASRQWREVHPRAFALRKPAASQDGRCAQHGRRTRRGHLHRRGGYGRRMGAPDVWW